MNEAGESTTPYAEHGVTAWSEPLATGHGADADVPVAEFSVELVDALIAEIDRKLSLQVNAILHHEDYLRLESTWRSLAFLLERVDPRQNIQVQFLAVSKEELATDFEDSPEVIKSGLYRHAYIAEFGQFGGKPVGCIVGGYAFGPGPRDLDLLQKIASVAAMAHAPFLATADKSFFGISDWSQLANLKDIRAVLDMPHYARWHALRASEDARYVGLALPGFLLRAPWKNRVAGASSFAFVEDCRKDGDFCWGGAAFAMAACMATSFARFRWCVNIVGPEGGGAVEGIAGCDFEATRELQGKTPVQVLVTEHREYELAAEGFMALAMRPGSQRAAFYSANSVQAVRIFGETAEGREAEMNYRLSTQLPYMMIMNRLAHYIKVIQRENIGLWKERLDLESELNKWVGQYVTAMDHPDSVTRSRRPLRMATVEVREVPGNTGWYRLVVRARPHFTYMGATFTLSLTGKLDKE